jgi:hypothetical protein
MATNAEQMCNLLEFVNKYCSFVNASSMTFFIHNIGVCASILDEWDLEIALDTEFNTITFDFYSPYERLAKVTAYIDLEEVTKVYKLEELDSYMICNKEAR